MLQGNILLKSSKHPFSLFFPKCCEVCGGVLIGIISTLLILQELFDSPCTMISYGVLHLFLETGIKVQWKDNGNLKKNNLFPHISESLEMESVK